MVGNNKNGKLLVLSEENSLSNESQSMGFSIRMVFFVERWFIFMKKIKKTMLLVCVLVLLLFSSEQIFAAVSLPSISSSKPITCYTINVSGRLYAYTSSALREKTGGYIDCATDECIIIKIIGNALQVKYPVSGGSRTAWFARSAFSSCNMAGCALEKWSQADEITTYRRADGRTKLGSISVGDVCYKLANSGNYTQAIYPISGGYKMGWIKTSEICKDTG